MNNRFVNPTLNALDAMSGTMPPVFEHACVAIISLGTDDAEFNLNSNRPPAIHGNSQ